ncbi:hypothetical protein D3C80_1516260 [compost metagenome]
MKINVGEHPLNVVSANVQRLVLGANPQAPGSFALLPFAPQLHAWSFNGEVIVEMPRAEAADTAKVKQRIEQAQRAWQPLLASPATPLNFKLVEKLADDRLDPASGSYLSVNNATH